MKKDKFAYTNKALSKDMNCTPRQISKSRKRGYITNNNGERIKYKAPEPVSITLKAIPKTQKWQREIRKKGKELLGGITS